MYPTTKHRIGGIDFTFSILPASRLTRWPSAAGLYIMAKYNGMTGRHEVLYVGQCSDYGSRLCTHERWDEAARRGMTHLLLCGVPRQDQRDQYEEMLIKDLHPPLNVMLRAQTASVDALFTPRRR